MFYAADSSNGLAALLPTGSMREFVTAHEVAHQWWHVLVGSDSRVSPFADESLTQYSAMLYFEDRYGKDRAHQEGEMNAKMTYQMMRLLGRADGRVDGPVSSFSPLSYAGLVYGKGPYFYDAVRKRIGDAAFFQALRTYVARHQFRLAPSTALVELLASGSRQQEVRALATRWLREAHGDQDLGSLALPGMAGLLGAQGKAPDISQLMEQIMKQLGSEMAP
jgi:aminopeptidase N